MRIASRGTNVHATAVTVMPRQANLAPRRARASRGATSTVAIVARIFIAVAVTNSARAKRAQPRKRVAKQARPQPMAAMRVNARTAAASRARAKDVPTMERATGASSGMVAVAVAAVTARADSGRSASVRSIRIRRLRSSQR